MSADLAEYQEAQVQGLPARQISEETCRHFGVRVGEFNGNKAHFYPYFVDGQVVACKVRGPDKKFNFIGNAKHPPLFGQNIYSSGKKIVVTEGEVDALTVSQLQGNKWATVSVPNGAQAAKRDIARQLEFFEKFEEVVLMFDMDEPGQKAAREVAELFPPGKAKIASLPLKDANDCLKAGKGAEVIQAIWNAKEYRPDGIVGVCDVLEDIDKPIEEGLPWFLEDLTRVTYGRRYGEVYTFGAGTGVGKTDLFTQQIAYDITELGLQVGLVFLEQNPTETVTRIAGKLKGKRFHVPGDWTKEERTAAVQELDGKVFLYNSFGETEWPTVKAKIRYMAHAMGIRVFYIDHLTAMADTSSERESLEQLMKELAGLANELRIIVHLISHLSTPDKGSHETGAQVTIAQFKGSRSIGFWSYLMIGLERNQQADDPEIRSTTTLRVLKDRYTGNATGHLIFLGFDRDTGLLYDKRSFEPDETAYEF